MHNVLDEQQHSLLLVCATAHFDCIGAMLMLKPFRSVDTTWCCIFGKVLQSTFPIDTSAVTPAVKTWDQSGDKAAGREGVYGICLQIDFEELTK